MVIFHVSHVFCLAAIVGHDKKMMMMLSNAQMACEYFVTIENFN